MLLTKTTTLEETVEIKLPAFFKTHTAFLYVQEKSILTVQFIGKDVSVQTDNEGTGFPIVFQTKLEKAVSNRPSTKEEFFDAWQRAMDQLQSGIYPVKANLLTH